LASFEREIFIAFQDFLPTAFFQRIYDMRYTPQKPYDFELFYQGYYFGLEAKHQKMHLDLRRIKDHQRANMKKVRQNGGYSFLLIRLEDPKKAQKKFRAFIISLEQFEQMEMETTKKSCNAKDLEVYAEFEAERIRLPSKKYTWNFPEFFIDFVKRGGPDLQRVNY